MSPSFDDWIAGSKVVDEDGQPMVVYHGTSAIDFTEFRRGRDLGIHFGSSDQANDLIATRHRNAHPDQSYADARLIPVHLAIRNPLRLNDVGDWSNFNRVADELDKTLEGSAWKDVQKASNIAGLRNALKANGYDGIVYLNDREVAGGAELRKVVDAAETAADRTAAEDAFYSHRQAGAADSWIAFESEQIRSAIVNRPSKSNARSAAMTNANALRRPVDVTTAFMAWFGNSQVVDAGKPRVVFHGSPNSGIQSFDRAWEGSNTGAANDQHGLGGFYFTDDPNVADTYARTIDVEMANIAEQEFGIKPRAGLPESTTYPVHLSLQNPLRIEGIVTRKVLEQARNGGNDGVIARMGSQTEYVAFNPGQIKSAIGNNGQYFDYKPVASAVTDAPAKKKARPKP